MPSMPRPEMDRATRPTGAATKYDTVAATDATAVVDTASGSCSVVVVCGDGAAPGGLGFQVPSLGTLRVGGAGGLQATSTTGAVVSGPPHCHIQDHLFLLHTRQGIRLFVRPLGR